MPIDLDLINADFEKLKAECDLLDAALERNTENPDGLTVEESKVAFLDHSSRFSFRLPQCLSLRTGSNSRTTPRWSALRTPMRASMSQPPPVSAARIKCSTATCHISRSCSALGSLVM
jgi:hypothetical protein